jgi:hypothetical protein
VQVRHQRERRRPVLPESALAAHDATARGITRAATGEVKRTSSWKCWRTASTSRPFQASTHSAAKLSAYLNEWDNSVFPASPAANPSLTLAALALRLAGDLDLVGAVVRAPSTLRGEVDLFEDLGGTGGSSPAAHIDVQGERGVGVPELVGGLPRPASSIRVATVLRKV